MANPVSTAPVSVLPPQSDSDETTIGLWLHGRSLTTRRAYESDARAFLALSGKSLRAMSRPTPSALPTWRRRLKPAGCRP
jgi:hypothetical protein